MFKEFNPNPTGRHVGDCAVRAVAKALGVTWEESYALIAANGFSMGDMPSSDSVWGSVLRQNGFYRKAIPSSCPDRYTAEDFCRDHPEGTYSTTESYARGRGRNAARDSMGRYSSEGYSRSGMAEELEHLMQKAPHEMKQDIQRLMSMMG